MHLTTLLILPLLPFALSAHTQTPRRHRSRSPQHQIVGRAGAAYSNDTIEHISEAAAYSASLAAAESASAPASVTASVDPDPALSSAAAITAGVTSSVDGNLASSAVGTSIVASQQVSSAVAVVSSAAASSVVASISTDPAITAAITSPSTAVLASTTPTQDGPSTILVSKTAILPSTVVVTHSSPARVTTATRTASSSSSVSAAASKESTSTTGINRTTLIAIIVVASVVGLAAAAFTAFRKWKLRPSNRFDERMKPINFAPQKGGMDDDHLFLEKTLHRSNSASSTDRQRQQYASDLDTSGIPEHDFTAGTNGAGHGTYNMDMYNSDPYAHAEAYDYDAQYQYGQQQQHQYPPVSYSTHGDYPTQDEPVGGVQGYADLLRGNSVGSGSGHAHAHGHSVGQAVYPGDFPNADNYLGRPTGGSDGPYAQAAQYRGY